MNSYLDNARNKILDLDRLQDVLEGWRAEGKKIAFTNGCFDILHLGHLTYLMQAAQLGDKLIVGLNSDESVRLQQKSLERPVQDQNSRALILAALEFTDAIVVFESETPLSLIELIKPDVLVKGTDYDPSQTDESQKSYIVGSKEVRANGGEVQAIPLLDGFSTTSIINRLKK